MCRFTLLLSLCVLARITLVRTCVRLSPRIEAKIAGLTGLTASPRIGTTPTPPRSAETEGGLLQPRLGGDVNTARRVPDTAENSVDVKEKSKTNTTSSTTDFMYTNRYDFVAIELVLTSPRLMRNFHECMMSRGPCTSEGSELKRIVPEALRNNCARCTEKQRVQAGKVLLYLLEHRPEWWQELLEKFDPDGSFRRKYEYEQDDEA